MFNHRKQKGMVLVVALIMLIAVTGVAVALLVSSGVDNKMMSSAQEAELAMNEARGAHDEAYSREINQVGGGQNQFSLRIPLGQSLPARETQPNTAGNIVVYSALPEPTTCPPAFSASSSSSCNYHRVTTATNYGEVGQTIRITSVVSQQLVN